jgi:hypothetical protein
MMTIDPIPQPLFNFSQVPARQPGEFPYDHIEPRQSWRASVTNVENGDVDPQSPPKFRLDRTTRIASAGSCFAQRLAEALQDYGFNYFVTEQAPEWLTPQQRADYSYGVYSARYGNVYTSLQLLQLVQRALGQFTPADDYWLGDGCYVDPFRPNIQPGGYASLDDLHADRRRHLAAVEQLLREVDVFVFTMGLTEGWCAAVDGAAFPTCPGHKFGEYDASKYVFRNLGVSENLECMEGFLGLLRELNPAARVLLTVSPVPLAATMEPRHVLEATVYSKSVLRVVAEELRRKHDNVEYFASYEIATAAYNTAPYFQPDKRNVTPDAVEHVMRSFFRNFAGEDPATMAKVAKGEQAIEFQHTPCEEEQLFQLIGGNWKGESA